MNSEIGWDRPVGLAIRMSLLVLLVVTLAGCQFEPSITPIVWPTLGPQPFGQAPLGPQPSPLPLAPTPVPPPPVFQGVDSLDCEEPKEGDNHYGYCRIPGTLQFYVWGECIGACPEGPYPGIEIMTVDGGDLTLQLFSKVVDERDQKLDERRKGAMRGGLLGGLGVALGLPAVPAACIVTGGWNLGTGCILVLGALAVDVLLSLFEAGDAVSAHTSLNEPRGLESGAQDLFQMLHDNTSPTNPGVP